MTGALTAGNVLAFAIPGLVLLALVVVLTTTGRRDRHEATGGLSRETRRRDRGAVGDDIVPAAAARPTGREVERAAALERRAPGKDVATTSAAPPAPVGPLDPEALGVTRRQFLNRGIVNMFGISLGGFGAACLAFLWTNNAAGFGAKINIPASLGDILDYYKTNREPYYYGPGRVYLSPYPKDSVSKAKKVYAPSVVAGMDAGVVALYQKCVHLGCRVPWCKTSQWFECPCHGSQYNRVGEKKGGPAPRGLDRFPVSVSGSRVQVDTGLVLQGPAIGTNTTGQEAEGPHCVTSAE